MVDRKLRTFIGEQNCTIYSAMGFWDTAIQQPGLQSGLSALLLTELQAAVKKVLVQKYALLTATDSTTLSLDRKEIPETAFFPILLYNKSDFIV